MVSVTSSSSTCKPSFSVKIVVCDHYLTKPVPGIDHIYSEFRGSDIKQVPVLRIFGSAPDGHKACLHIHGVFPYFYIPCPSSNPEPQFLYQLAASLDKALNIALKQASSANQHIYKITLVKGLPFYGFHDKEHLFLKVFLYSPNLIKQAVELCNNGAILGQTFQPHESHLNFTLQFFIDFNLFGMSNIDLQSVNFRKRRVSQSSEDLCENLNESNLKPESMCYYEADCIASHIINRQRIGRGDGIENPGLEEVWNQEKERRKQLNVSMASKSLSQGRFESEETDSHHKFEQMFLHKLSNLTDLPIYMDKFENNSIPEVNYPAISLEGSQFLSAVDVSVHLPEISMNSSLNETLVNSEETQNFDKTLVDENIALNCSLPMHYSQVLLDSEDLNLLELLKDMDEKPVEEDSAMATPASIDEDSKNQDESDDLEYSQIFNEDTLLIDNNISKDNSEECLQSWNDSFWDGANITQLDGTFDDDHVKKVRKRKMRPLQIGLARPNSKKKGQPTVVKDEPSSKLDLSIVEEINESQESTKSVTAIHFKNSVKLELDSAIECEDEVCNKDLEISNESITDLVKKATVKNEKHNASKCYDKRKQFEPVAGPSNINCNKIDNKEVGFILNSNVNDEIFNDSFESTTESDNDKSGFMSFYDKSKVFDVSADEDHEFDSSQELLKTEKNNSCKSNKIENDEQIPSGDLILHYSHTLKSPVVDKYVVEIYPAKPHEHVNIENTTILTPKFRPPTRKYINDTLEKYGIPKEINPKPFYSDYKHVGDKVEIGQMIIKINSYLAHDQKPMEKVLIASTLEEWRKVMFLQSNDLHETAPQPDNLKALLAGNRECILQPLKNPPTSKEVKTWLESEDIINSENKSSDHTEARNIDDLDSSQVIGLNETEINSSLRLDSVEKEKGNMNESLQITMQPDGSFLCFGSGQSQKEISDTPVVEVDYLTIMILEVHAEVRGNLNPDPSIDPVKAVFITVTNDCPTNHHLPKMVTEIIVVDESKAPKLFDRCVVNARISYVDNESQLFERVLELVQKHDPDIICGYEIEMKSWGYMLARSQVLGLEMVMEISRITEKHRQKRWRSDENDFEGRIIGRVLFNVWRLFRHELALSSYSFENCMYEVLKERVPKYSFTQLAQWWNEESRLLRWVPVEYYLTRLSGTVRMLEKLDIINRTSELARLFGLQWWEVLSRGSQFRVESLMLRAARPLNLLALSPSVRQRAAMRAPQCLPLILEPASRFYSDPVIVLDFQSLYPSMMIAYNYCFSTCIGQVDNINGDAPYEFGAWRLRIPKAKLSTLMSRGLVHWSPVGVGFVRSSVRRGVLPALLRRILAARQAVKKGAKLQTDEGVKKAMHSRQLGLKLIANVTYGYTAANFSGRMPCVELGDSVVAKGRETLQRAIRLVETQHPRAKVIYGDTDSMFVLVPGASRQEAFIIGQQIADAVTADNPSPVVLKLEKVYQPCILQTKKRYVGYMYESADQEQPVFEAKGIETVRRDGCPAGVKLLKDSLCCLFSTGDMSQVRRRAERTLRQLAEGNMPVHELFFTREYHGPGGYRPGAHAPPMEIARRLSSVDRRSVPRAGERVSWLVTAGAPGTPLVHLARTPAELRRDPALAPHVMYYATRALLPPLHRCLALLGVNVLQWWNELGYGREAQLTRHVQAGGGIARYLGRRRCSLCAARSSHSVCGECARRPQRAAAALGAREQAAQRAVAVCEQICASCCGHQQSVACENAECPSLWRRRDAQQARQLARETRAQLPPDLAWGKEDDYF